MKGLTMRYYTEEAKNCNECPFVKMVTLQLDVLEIYCTEMPEGKNKLYYSPTYPEIPDRCPLPKEKPQ